MSARANPRVVRATGARAPAARRPARIATRRAPRPALRIEPATAERWSALASLFGSRGACGGCWCMWARKTAAEFREGKGDANRRALQRRVKATPAPGLIAFDGETPVGWVTVGPRTEFVRLESSRVLAPVDDAPVWSVPCFFVAPSHRGRGVSVALLRAAAAFAAANGARLLEGYPEDTRGRRAPPVFIWVGVAGAFRAAGFREVARRSPNRPIMRKVLRAARASGTSARPAARRG
jgi:GNAT superfamily N-acetyltransferase